MFQQLKEFYKSAMEQMLPTDPARKYEAPTQQIHFKNAILVGGLTKVTWVVGLFTGGQAQKVDNSFPVVGFGKLVPLAADRPTSTPTKNNIERLLDEAMLLRATSSAGR